MQNSNIPIANCIFTPTVACGTFFISFLGFHPKSMSGDAIIMWAAIGSLVAVFIGIGIGWCFRNSESYNLLLRWLIGGLMAFLVLYALYSSYRDIFIL